MAFLSACKEGPEGSTASAQELLGKPTANSVTINVVPRQDVRIYYEFGTAQGSYTNRTPDVLARAGEAYETTLSGLAPNTRYYYRMRYQTPGDIEWVARDEHTFHTQRARGEEFVFTIIADSHLDHLGGAEGPQRYRQATLNVAADNPDFHIDLGDTFVSNGLRSQAEVDGMYLQQRQYFDNFGHSSPVFLAIGNHENEEGWNFDDDRSLALMSIEARKKYYPTPVSDGFYSGNDDRLPAIGGDQLREDYYAFEWGDALFVILDPFHYTMANPYGAFAGEAGDDRASGDQWNWTLGKQQYDWLERTLANSDAKFKFLFAHHVTGGQPEGGRGGSGSAGYVRGGVSAAPYFEWGGRNADGSWGFDQYRGGWRAPIHQLMVENGVNAFFHGHDHQYAHEEYDGVIYNAVPSPTLTGNGFNIYSENEPYTKRALPNSGHLRVTVGPEQFSVEYVRSDSTTPGTNGQVSHSYVVNARQR